MLKTRDKITHHTQRLSRAERSLDLLNPQRVLERGYAVLQDSAGHVVGSAKAVQTGQKVKATLADGTVDLTAN